MPRPSKGPRLFLRKARPAKRQAAGWVIRDGAKEISTGCGPGDLGAAEQALGEYIQEKHTPAPGAERGGGASDPADVLVADVINFYATGKKATAPDPSALTARLNALLDFFGEDTLADIRRSRCEKYVAVRITQPIKSFKKAAEARLVTVGGARRELEDLSSAIGYWHDEYPLTRRPKVVLPPKPESTRDAITRSQAAALLLAAMGWKLDKMTGKWKRQGRAVVANRRHLRRFILIGVYTGPRPGVIPQLLWAESPKQAWVDLEDEIIYRRGKAERDHRTKRRPLVKIPARLLAHLRRWREADLAMSAAMRAEHVAAGGDAKTAPQITTVLHHGKAPIDGRIRRSFASAVADAGLSEDITPHWLRHTCATWLMEADAKPWEAAGFTGMSTKTLEEHYGHHRPSHQARVKNLIGSRR